MNLDIIIAPVVTEKTSYLNEDGKTYIFKVDAKANKTAIKHAVEKAFDVKVEKVNTLNTKPKEKRVGKYSGYRKTYKKAIVTLADGHTIEM